MLLLGEEASQEVARERVQAIPVQYIEQIFGHPNMLDPYFMMEHFGAPNLDSGTLLPPWRAFARAEAPAPEAFTAFWGRGAFPEMSRQRIEALAGWHAGYFSNGGEVPCGVYTDGTKQTQASPRAQGFGSEEGCFWWPAVGAKLRLGPTDALLRTLQGHADTRNALLLVESQDAVAYEIWFHFCQAAAAGGWKKAWATHPHRVQVLPQELLELPRVQPAPPPPPPPPPPPRKRS